MGSAGVTQFVCVCVLLLCVCARGKRSKREVTRGGHFKQATTTMASAAVLNDCHVLFVSPSPPLLLLLLYVVLAQFVVVVTGLVLPPLFVCGYKHIWH